MMMTIAAMEMIERGKSCKGDDSRGNGDDGNDEINSNSGTTR